MLPTVHASYRHCPKDGSLGASECGRKMGSPCLGLAPKGDNSAIVRCSTRQFPDNQLYNISSSSGFQQAFVTAGRSGGQRERELCASLLLLIVILQKTTSSAGSASAIPMLALSPPIIPLPRYACFCVLCAPVYPSKQPNPSCFASPGLV